jgi:hypothetical protein
MAQSLRVRRLRSAEDREEELTEPVSLEERVGRLEGKVAALTAERETHTQELDYLRERNKALEAAMAASAALIKEAIEPSGAWAPRDEAQPS